MITKLKLLESFKLIRLLFLSLILGLTITCSFRLILIFSYEEFSHIFYYWQDFIKDFFLGFKIDLKTITFSFIPLYLLSIYLVFFDKFKNFIKKLAFYYSSFFLITLLFFSCTNYFFYSFFQNPLDVNFFLFFHWENGKTIFFSHTFKFIFGIGILFIFFSFIYRFLKTIQILFEHNYTKNNPLKKIIYFSFLFITLILSVSGFKYNDSLDSSDNILFNKAIPNGLYSFVRQLRKRAFGLNNLKYKEFYNEELIKSYNFIFNKNNNNVSIKDFQFKTTLKNNNSKPHVVFCLLESFANFPMTYHSKNINILGKFTKHLKEDYLFKNFLPSSTTTLLSIESIFFYNNIYNDFSLLVENLDKYYPLSVFSKFQKNGYKTIFLTSGSKNWYNMGKLFKQQNIQFYDQEYFKKKYNIENHSIWGVDDKVLFQEVQEILKKAKEPLFITILTTNNHSPFNMPKRYTPINSDTLKKEGFPFYVGEEENKALTNYQYISNCVGEFLDNLKNNKVLKEKVIFSATGDHSYRFFNKNIKQKDYVVKMKVPFYLYLPKMYQKNTVKKLNRYGSHKDIFPTIFNRIFSNYIKTGNDLLSNSLKESKFIGFNKELLIFKEGAILLREENKPIFFKWKNQLGEVMINLSNEKDVFYKKLDFYKKYDLAFSWFSHFYYTKLLSIKK